MNIENSVLTLLGVGMSLFVTSTAQAQYASRFNDNLTNPVLQSPAQLYQIPDTEMRLDMALGGTMQKDMVIGNEVAMFLFEGPVIRGKLVHLCLWRVSFLFRPIYIRLLNCL